jgi:hypothetical protein
MYIPVQLLPDNLVSCQDIETPVPKNCLDGMRAFEGSQDGYTKVDGSHSVTVDHGNTYTPT